MQKKQTKEQLLKEIFRFLLVGGLATLLDYATAYFFYGWILPPSLVGAHLSLLISTALGFLVGLLVNWKLSVLFVFQQVNDKEKASSKNSFVRFTIIGLIGLGITELGMLFLPLIPEITLFSSTSFLNVAWNWWFLKAFMTCLVLIWNYLARKAFIFKS